MLVQEGVWNLVLGSTTYRWCVSVMTQYFNAWCQSTAVAAINKCVVKNIAAVLRRRGT